MFEVANALHVLLTSSIIKVKAHKKLKLIYSSA